MSIRVIGPLSQDTEVLEQVKDYAIDAVIATDITKLYKSNREHTNLFATLETNTEIFDIDRAEFELTITSKIVNFMANLTSINYIDLPTIRQDLIDVETRFNISLLNLENSLNSVISTEVATIRDTYDTKIDKFIKETNQNFINLNFSVDSAISDLYSKYSNLKSRIEKLEIENY